MNSKDAEPHGHYELLPPGAGSGQIEFEDNQLRS